MSGFVAVQSSCAFIFPHYCGIGVLQYIGKASFTINNNDMFNTLAALTPF